MTQIIKTTHGSYNRFRFVLSGSKRRVSPAVCTPGLGASRPAISIQFTATPS